MPNLDHALPSRPLPNDLAAEWRRHITRLGATAVGQLDQRQYLAATPYRHGLCAGMVGHLAAAWLHDRRVARGRRRFSALLDALTAQGKPPHSLMTRRLVAWSVGGQTAKFGSRPRHDDLTLAALLDRLAQAVAPAAFELSFCGHAMLLAKQSASCYLLADPNFGHATLADQAVLARVLDWHRALTQRLLAPTDSRQTPHIFTLRQFRDDLPLRPPTQRAAPAPMQWPALAAALPDTLSEEVMSLLQGAAEEVRATTPRLPSLAEDLSLGLSAGQQRATQMAARLERSLSAMLAQSERPADRVPLFDGLAPEPSGGMRLPFADRQNPEAPPLELVSADDDHTLAEMKALLEKNAAQMRRAGAVLDKHATATEGSLPGEDLAIDGLNAAFMVQAIQRLLSRRPETAPQTPVRPGLAMALQLHDYANMLMVGAGAAQDVLRGAALVKALRALSAGETLPGASLGLLGKGTALLQTLSVGLDIYELTQAQTENQRAVFGTNLFFDSSGLAALIASAAGVPVAGQLGVIIAGLGIGVGGLVSAFNDIANKAAAVGQYFANLRRAYHTRGDTLGAGYEYDAARQTLAPAYPAVVIKLDLRQQQATLVSPLLYPAKHGATGSGRRNYFFWAGDMPRVQHDRQRAIDTCQRLQYPLEPMALPGAARTARHIVLPSVPRHYISYSYNMLPFATARQDGGFDVLRQLEGDDFDFDFYIFPSEYLIDQLHFEYVDTAVDVLLATGDCQLYMPTFPAPVQGHLRYTLHADSGQYRIVLSPGASLTLTAAPNAQYEWLLDARPLSDDEPQFDADRAGVVIGGVSVRVSSAGAPLTLVRKNGVIERLIVAEARRETVEIDAARWPASQLAQYLHDLGRQHLAHGDVVQVKDYPLPGTPAKTIPLAYYDTAGGRMLYVAEDQRYPQCALALIDGDQAYFYNHLRNKVLRIDPRTLAIEAEFSLRDSPEIRLWREGGAVLLSRVPPVTKKQPSAIFSLENDTLYLRRATLDAPLVSLLENQDRLSDMTTDLQSILAEHFTWQRPNRIGGAVLPLNGYVVLDHSAGETVKVRYWLRTRDGALIRPRLPAGDLPTQEDLALAHTDTLPDGDEACFFYHAPQKALYHQRGRGYGTNDLARKLTIEGLASLSILDDQLYAQTEQGLIVSLDAQGRSTPTAVTRSWLAARPQWPDDLLKLAADGTLSVLDLKRADGGAQPAWTMGGRIVLAGPNLPADTQLIGLGQGTEEAWLYNPRDRALYRQPLLSRQDILRAYGAVTQTAGVEIARAELKRQFAGLSIQGATLTVELLDGVLPPPMRNITQLLLAPTVAMALLRIGMDDWRLYQRIGIDVGRLPAVQPDQAAMTIEIALTSPLALSATREGDDLLLFDRASGKSLLVLRLFTPAQQRKVSVRVRDAVGDRVVADGIHEALANADPEIWRMLITPPELKQTPPAP